jgi:hypothetical protein
MSWRSCPPAGGETIAADGAGFLTNNAPSRSPGRAASRAAAPPVDKGAGKVDGGAGVGKEARS